MILGAELAITGHLFPSSRLRVAAKVSPDRGNKNRFHSNVTEAYTYYVDYLGREVRCGLGFEIPKDNPYPPRDPMGRWRMYNYGHHGGLVAMPYIVTETYSH